jgi:hypothetical protein
MSSQKDKKYKKEESLHNGKTIIYTSPIFVELRYKRAFKNPMDSEI